YSGGGSRVTQLGWAGTVPVPADYDGDGRADVAVLSRASSTWCISYSGGGSLVLPFGYRTMTPVPADYDGDGAADVAMCHEASGRWYVRQSSNGAHRQETLGGPDFIPVLLLPLIHSWFGLP
ncbi:MAG: VCBS repeat-containing protein, partial [Spartobacteria bacterium]|nr:VCBS repeat-containing protein [Spartobacteria bacterium]